MEKKILIILETSESEEKVMEYFRDKLLWDFDKKRIKLIEVDGKEKIKYPK